MNKLAKTYQVTFCAYTVFPEHKGFVDEFALRNEDGESLFDAVTVVFVELSKLEGVLRKPVEEMTSLEMWAIFLQYADKPEKKEIVERVAEAKGEVKMALNTLIHVSQDERERAINRSRRIWQTDMESNLNTAKESGRIEGQRDAILKMRKANMSDEQIAGIYELPVNIIRKIADSSEYRQ